MNEKILVTGANGFIGKVLCQKLLSDDFQVRAAVRANRLTSLPEGVEPRGIKDIDAHTDWTEIVGGIDAIVHLAARVHVMDDKATDPFAEYWKVNVAGTEQLARAAVEAGVSRFVFLSTVKVNGEETVRPYRESDPPAPQDSYAISKLQAEEKLKEIASESGMQLVILRPPLVYGPGVKANFLALIKMVAKRLPLPLASISNRRSFIYVENLTDAIVTCCIQPNAAGNVYLVSDGDDLSTPELIRRIAAALSEPVRLFPCPEILIFFLGRISGKGPAVDRLIGSLAVDISKIDRELNWRPPISMAHGLRKTADWYLSV